MGASPDARVMTGTALARQIADRAALRADEFEKRTGHRPCLATVLVGDDPAAAAYVRMKRNRGDKAGIASREVALPATTTTDDLVTAIAKLSRDATVHGILLHRPLPRHIDERAACEAIDVSKDVDGVTIRSFGSMALGGSAFAGCTPEGIMRLLDAYEVDPAGQHAVVIGGSPILGKPMGMLLLARDATVTICHSKTRDLPSIVRTGDIIVAAVGKPTFVRGDWLKPGAVVIDAGYNEGNVGDVAFAEALATASLLTPVPGGVGPTTISLLLEQTVEAAIRQEPPR